MVNLTVLVVDDEVSIARLVRHAFEAQAGVQVLEARTGAEALERAVQHRPDLIILDHGLPDFSGLVVLERVREWSRVPVIFLTVRDGDDDKVRALDAGADDYLTKPFSVPELLARARVALRHARPAGGAPELTYGPLRVDVAGHLAHLHGQELRLTSTEFALLLGLVRHAGRVVPHRAILSDVWGPNAVEHTHYLRVYFGQIRKKFEATSPGAGELIVNEPGIGYRLRAPVD